MKVFLLKKCIILLNFRVRKILNLRLFDSEEKRWSKSVTAEDLDILCISQVSFYLPLLGRLPKHLLILLCFKLANAQEIMQMNLIKLYLYFLPQFTLYSVLKGNKPDFHLAMDGEKSKPLYEELLLDLGKNYKPEKVKGGFPMVCLLNVKGTRCKNTNNYLIMVLQFLKH